MHRRLLVLEPRPAARLALQPAVAARDRRALAGQDPREHGDRPQRHARPVGLDERPPDPLLDLGLGHRVDRRGVEALPQLRPPHLHQHPRQGPDLGYEIMRIDPHQKWHPVYLLQPLLQPGAGGVLRVGRRVPRPRLRGDQEGEKSKEQISASSRACAQGAARRSSRTTSRGRSSPALAAGASRRSAPRRRGVRRKRKWEDAAATALERGWQTFRATRGELHGQRRAQRLGLRDHLLRALPRPDLHLQPGRGRGRDARRLLRPPAAAARRTSRAARSSTSPQRQPRLPGRAPPLPGHAEHALRRDRPARQGDLRALRAALQHGPVPQQLGEVQRTILRLAFPGGKPRPKPGPTRRDGRRRRPSQQRTRARPSERRPARTARARSSTTTACASRCPTRTSAAALGGAEQRDQARVLFAARRASLEVRPHARHRRVGVRLARARAPRSGRARQSTPRSRSRARRCRAWRRADPWTPASQRSCDRLPQLGAGHRGASCRGLRESSRGGRPGRRWARR